MQHLEKRLRRHKLDESKLNDETALAVHASLTGHRFNFKNTRILLHENNTRKRKFREIIEILKHKSVNFKADSSKLGPMYGPIITRSQVLLARINKPQ